MKARHLERGSRVHGPVRIRQLPRAATIENATVVAKFLAGPVEKFAAGKARRRRGIIPIFHPSTRSSSRNPQQTAVLPAGIAIALEGRRITHDINEEFT